MRFKIPTKYPLEIAAVTVWIIMMAISYVGALRQHRMIDESYIYEKIQYNAIFALVYYIFLLRRELKKIKSK